MQQSGNAARLRLQIEIIHSTQNKYYYDGQLFDLLELKLLVDTVSSSKLITERKSEQLINKLLALAPLRNAMQSSSGGTYTLRIA